MLTNQPLPEPNVTLREKWSEWVMIVISDLENGNTDPVLLCALGSIYPLRNLMLTDSVRRWLLDKALQVFHALPHDISVFYRREGVVPTLLHHIVDAPHLIRVYHASGREDKWKELEGFWELDK